jgi:hypothetical protein
VLTELQERVARIIAELPEARGFALAGGAALVVHGLTERSTNDLDYFTTAPADVPTLRRAIEMAMAQAGFTVTAVTASEEFVRLEVRDGTADTRIDLAWDARMRPPVATDFGTVLHEDELAADKLLAVFGRAEARDFLDVFGLSQRLGWERLLELAKQKDAGVSPERLAESFGLIDLFDRSDFGIDATAYEALMAWAHQTRASLQEHRPPKRPGRRL